MPVNDITTQSTDHTHTRQRKPQSTSHTTTTRENEHWDIKLKKTKVHQSKCPTTTQSTICPTRPNNGLPYQSTSSHSSDFFPSTTFFIITFTFPFFKSLLYTSWTRSFSITALFRSNTPRTSTVFFGDMCMVFRFMSMCFFFVINYTLRWKWCC